jgi:micrococcal nuclease
MSEYQFDPKYVYRATVERVVDGDTIDLLVEPERVVDFGFGVYGKAEAMIRQRFRLYGIDTPETYSVKRDSEEYAAGMRAKERLQEICNEGDQVWIHSRKSGKFGRYLAVVWVLVAEDFARHGVISHSVNATLVMEGLAALYESDPLPIEKRTG